MEREPMEKIKPQHSKSLEKRFEDFLDSRVEARNIDEMNIPPEFQHMKKADYLLNGNIVVEIKSLKDDPSYKIEERLAPHREREEFPVFYWDAPIQEVLKNLPDGDKINEKIFFSITKSLQHCFERSDDQISDTKTIIDENNASGVVVLLNESIEILEPKTIAYIARYMMNKRNKDGSLRYQNIHYAYLVSEAHFYNVHDELISMPIILIDGPLADQHPDAAERFEQYNYEWAAFNNVPLLKYSGEPQKLLADAFHAFGNEEKGDFNEMQRHELWRKQYRDYPYLKELSEADFIKYGEKVIEKGN